MALDYIGGPQTLAAGQLSGAGANYSWNGSGILSIAPAGAEPGRFRVTLINPRHRAEIEVTAVPLVAIGSGATGRVVTVTYPPDGYSYIEFRVVDSIGAPVDCGVSFRVKDRLNTGGLYQVTA